MALEQNGNKFIIQSLAKGITILDCFKSDIEEYGITELAAMVDLPESTVQRIINTLEYKGYIFQNPSTRKYRLSLKMLRFCHSTKNMNIWIENIKTHTTYLYRECKETVNLAIRDEDSMIYIAKVESEHLLRPNFILGAHYPLYCTGLGKCLLSDFPEEKLASLFPKPLKKLTPKTKANLKDIINDLRKVKSDGYIIDDEEFQLGLYCISAPIYGFNKVIASLSVSMPKARFNGNMEHLIKLIIETSNNISNEYKKVFEETD